MRLRPGTAWGGGAALLAGAALRVVFLLHHPRVGGDALLYGDLAHNMLSHHTYGFTEVPDIRSTLIRLPGYPLFLAASFLIFGQANYVAVIWLQAVLDLGTCLLLAVLASRLLGRRAGFAALWLAALCPFTANYCAVALAEIPCLFTVVLALFGLERWIKAWRRGEAGLGWAAVTGAALIYGVLLRPDQALLCMAVVPAMLVVGLKCGQGSLLRKALPAVLASAIIALPLSLWAVRNWEVFGVFQPLAPRYANDPGESNPYGFQRWYRTWAIEFKATYDVYWAYDGSPVDIDDLPQRAFDTPAQRAATEAIYDQYNLSTTSTPAFDAEFARIAAERVKAHPLRYYVVLPVARDLNMWLRPRTELIKVPIDWWNFADHPWASTAALAYAVLNAAYLLLGACGLWLWRRSGWRGMPALSWATVAYVALRFALLLTLDNSEPRYTLVCFPVVILWASVVFARTDA